jgi:pimeloyl-ACP methyl ester carboxylesterase
MYDDYDRRTRQVVLWLYRATHRADVTVGPRDRPFETDVPALVLWGKADPFVPVRFAEQQRQTFKRAKVVIFPEAGHWPFIDDPDGVAAEVVPFLRALVVSPASRNVAGR